MALGTLLFGLALFILVVLVVSWPLFGRKRPAVRPMSRRDALEHERESIVREIRELDFDYRTGKVNTEDYKQLREARLARGALILRELAALEGNANSDPEQAIEAQVARLRTVSASDGKSQAAPSACPQCGEPVRPGDRFCPQCGAPLQLKPSKAAIGAE